jgi:tetratricopeptide (TPR) repeat protein
LEVSDSQTLSSADALELYSQALQLATDAREAAVLSSNIAAVLLKLDRPAESLQYARASTEVTDSAAPEQLSLPPRCCSPRFCCLPVQVNPRWAKGFYRQASALQALQQHTPAAEALQQALALTQRGTPEVGAVDNQRLLLLSASCAHSVCCSSVLVG